MKNFGKDGSLGDWDSERRRGLFIDVVTTINRNKMYSIAGTLDSERYLRIFKGVSNLSMYGSAFMMVVMANGILMQRHSRPGVHNGTIDYVLDDGNHYQPDIREARSVLLAKENNDQLCMGDLTFEADECSAELQVADVVAWSVRRKLSSTLASGYEPLDGLFDDHHTEAPYKEQWMTDVAEALRRLSKSET